MIATMPQVHPTAIVDSRAELSDGVTVGPWCVIEGAVKIGTGTRLLHRVTLKGPLTIGARNVFYPNACVGYEPQDRKFDPQHEGAGVVIGDDNLFREGVTVHRATKARPTTIGNRNYLMVNSHVGHDDLLHDDITLANGVLLAGHVEIADRVTIGGNAAVHQFCRIGRLSMISGVIGVPQDVPPFVTVYGTRLVGSLNLVGLRRSGYRENIRPLRQAFGLLYRQGHTVHNAAALITQQLGADPLCAEFAAFIGGTKRGITASSGSRLCDSPAESPA
jgi:UDP-N-acetylglucosamine acyltransferase